MKSIESLLELRKNPYYTFSDEEQEALDSFLSKNSEQERSQKTNSKDSEKNIPATVVNKNIVPKHTGVLETADNQKISEDLAEIPASSINEEDSNVQSSSPTPSAPSVPGNPSTPSRT